MKKYIEVDTEMEKLLHSLCDMSLKYAGMQSIAPVSQLINSIKTKRDDEEA